MISGENHCEQLGCDTHVRGCAFQSGNAEQQVLRKGLTYLMAVVKPSRTGCEAAASGALYCAAESALQIASPLTCVRLIVRHGLQQTSCKFAHGQHTTAPIACDTELYLQAVQVWLAIYT